MSGVVPIGAFLLFHIWTTLSIVGSREIYDRQIAFLHAHEPRAFFGFLEIVLVLLPLAFHGGYGVYRSFQPREKDNAYGSMLMVTLQRVSGIVILVFVVLHVVEFRYQTWAHGREVASYSTTLIEHLSSTQSGVPLIALGYLVGLAASFFHLSNGLTSFCMTVAPGGAARTPEAKRRFTLFFRLAGLFFFFLSAAMVIQIATGTRFFAAEPPPSSTTVCNAPSAVPPAPLAHPSSSALPTTPR